MDSFNVIELQNLQKTISDNKILETKQKHLSKYNGLEISNALEVYCRDGDYIDGVPDMRGSNI